MKTAAEIDAEIDRLKGAIDRFHAIAMEAQANGNQRQKEAYRRAGIGRIAKGEKQLTTENKPEPTAAAKRATEAIGMALLEAFVSDRTLDVESIIDAEIRPLLDALVAVTPSHRAIGCWCGDGEIEHTMRCRSAQAAMQRAKGE